MSETAFDMDEVCIVMNETDNVAIARRTLAKGTAVLFGETRVVLRGEVPVGHKLARRDVAPGEPITRWGFPIGSATAVIRQGDHVHMHNMKSDYIPTFLAGEFVSKAEEDPR